MKIVFCTPGYKPAWRMGGPVHSVSALAEHLVRRGHEVSVFTSNANLDEELDVPTNRVIDVEGVAVTYFRREEPMKKAFHRIPYFGNSSGFIYTKGMEEALSKVVPTADIVHTHLPFVYPTLAAARASRRFGTPLVYSQRGVLDPARLKFRSLKKAVYLRFVELPVLKRASMLIALTQAEVKSYRRLGLNNPCRIIPNGISAQLYSTSAVTHLTASLGIRPTDTVVLFLARIHPIKGADRLLESFIRIHSRCPSAKLIFAGPDEFGLERSYVRRAQAEGLADSVIFTGMVSGDDKSALLRRADLFVLPSVAEGFSMAILEAMAASTAVLMSPGCNFPEAEASGAAVVCGTEPEALSACLLDLLSSTQRLKVMGRKGQELVTRRFSWSHIADLTLDAYGEVMDMGRREVRS